MLLVGVDDGACEIAADGVHRFDVVALVPNPGGAGMAQQLECLWCGAVAYEASAADDPRRPPLTDAT